MPRKAGLGKALDEILPDLAKFLPVRDIIVSKEGNDGFTH
jgi:hypothetical protein